MKKKIGFTLLLLVVAVGAAWWFTRPAPIEMSSTTSYLLDWPERVIVETGMGTVTGLSNGQSLVFLGLPYPQPPRQQNHKTAKGLKTKTRCPHPDYYRQSTARRLDRVR